MKKKILLLLLLFVPFIVNARQIDDLKLKWSDSLDYDGYMYNPFLEADEEYFNIIALSESWYNKSKILELEDGYIIFGNNSISKYDFNNGLQKDYSYYSMNYLIDGDLVYIISYSYRENASTLDIYDTDLNLVKTFSETNYKYLTMFIDGDNLVCTAFNSDGNEYHLLTVTLNKKTFEIKKQSKIFTYNYPYSESNSLFTAENNTFYIDKNYELKPYSALKNNKYIISYNNKIHLYSLDGNLEKTVDLPTNDYTIRQIKQITNDNKIYVGVQEYQYDSISKTYNHRVSYYLYDKDLNLIDSTQITAPSTTSYYSYYMYMYQNSNGVFTSYASKYYKLDEDLNFTETEQKYLYNDIGDMFEEKIEPNIDIQAFEFSEYLIEDQYVLICNELEKKYNDFYIYPTYDTYYDKDTEEFKILVNWNYIIYGSQGYTYKTKTELMIFGGENLELKNKIKILDEETVNDIYRPNAVMDVTDEYITIGVTSGGITKIFFYDHDYNLVKEFKTKNTGKYAIQKAEYKDGRLLLIYTEPRPGETSLSKGATTDNMFITSSSPKFPMAKLEVGPRHEGLYAVGDAMIVEYYEAPFNIVTKTDGNGTVTATQKKADRGTDVEFEVKPNEGYVLGNVKVIDNDGNVIIFTDYKFTMPSADVIIEATFIKEEKNPETSDILIVLFILTTIISIGFIIKNKKKMEWMN